MAATTRRLLQCVSKTAGARRSYGGLPQSKSKSPPSSSHRLMELESEFSAHNYHPVPVVFSCANGSTIWDPEGKRYIDFLAAYSAVNQGHCHPKIVKALHEQVEKLTLSSRAFYNDKFPVFAERLTNMFGYDMVLPMNTGAEGVETALKLARKWGHEKKNIPKDEILGKALGGGVIPVSVVLADKDVMLHIRPGQHGSTFGGNPLASAVAMASLDVIEEEKLVERSASLGEELRIQLSEIKQQFPSYIKEVRGRGLFNAVEFNSESLSPVSAYDICLSLKERGVLAKPTHNTIVRLTPPLSISSEELREGSKALHDVLELDLPNLQKINSGQSTKSHLTECDRCGRNLYT